MNAFQTGSVSSWLPDWQIHGHSFAGRLANPGTSRKTWAGFLVLVALIVVAFGVRFLGNFSPATQQLSEALLPPVGFGGAWDHPLGTDQLGRDLLDRSIAGLGTSLLVGLLVATLAGVVGVLLGLIAGNRGQLTQAVVSFLTDVQLTLPVLVLGIAFAAMTKPGVRTVVVVLALASWPVFERIVGGQTRQVAKSAYVDSARAVGASESRILLRHQLPNLLGLIVVLFTQQAAAAMLFEATLTYVGAGLPTETISLGGMIADGRNVLFVAWWVPAIPGMFLALVILGLTLVGDGLGAVVDPRSSH